MQPSSTISSPHPLQRVSLPTYPMPPSTGQTPLKHQFSSFGGPNSESENIDERLSAYATIARYRRLGRPPTPFKIKRTPDMSRSATPDSIAYSINDSSPPQTPNRSLSPIVLEQSLPATSYRASNQATRVPETLTPPITKIGRTFKGELEGPANLQQESQKTKSHSRPNPLNNSSQPAHDGDSEMGLKEYAKIRRQLLEILNSLHTTGSVY